MERPAGCKGKNKYDLHEMGISNRLLNIV